MRHALRALFIAATVAAGVHVALLALFNVGKYDASDYLTPKGPTK